MAELSGSKKKLALSALDLFAERGFSGTAIRDIATATGLSISNIYHHFGNKEGLLLAILEEASSRVLASLKEITEQKGDPVDVFKLLVKTHLQLSCLMNKESKIFFLDEEHLSPEGHRANLKYQREILETYRQQLRGLQAAGRVHFKSATIAAFNILGVVNWHLRWYQPEGQMSFDEVSEEVVDFILHGIGGQP